MTSGSISLESLSAIERPYDDTIAANKHGRTGVWQHETAFHLILCA